MNREKVLVIGGAGYFGRLLADDLRRYTRCEPVIASRHSSVKADLSDRSSLEAALSGVKIAVCAAGPFQRIPTSLAELCLERGIHYIDLADDRGFVQRVRALAENRGSPAAVCTGWSTVSALSGAMAALATEGMSSVDSIYIHMAPGNRGARRVGTIASLLHSVGRPFTVLRDGRPRSVAGWSEPREFRFPSPVGVRRGYLIDVPDHELFPEYFNARTVEFRAGSELAILNGCLSLLRRTGRPWAGWSRVFQRGAALFSWIGSDAGAIGVEVSGTSHRRVTIVADSAGERIAVMPASIMVDSLLSGGNFHGLVKHSNWITHEQMSAECERRGFRLVVEEL